ncbi:hypothetical protein [Flavobacterium daemonense]|uniref:hypothetical protein n=1 Tax=Flavobacterium daemonense TaxID=1393049 RepID=UPI0011872C6A|nr:hypothetical protein [Flavobacterium daemonense]KAF2337206.1 hypothetical protein FND99_01990 [Flavobacterium daemonense]
MKTTISLTADESNYIKKLLEMDLESANGQIEDAKSENEKADKFDLDRVKMSKAVIKKIQVEDEKMYQKILKLARTTVN